MNKSYGPQWSPRYNLWHHGIGRSSDPRRIAQKALKHIQGRAPAVAATGAIVRLGWCLTGTRSRIPPHPSSPATGTYSTGADGCPAQLHHHTSHLLGRLRSALERRKIEILEDPICRYALNPSYFTDLSNLIHTPVSDWGVL